MATPPNPTDSVDYSASATVVYFSPPVPLLRIPIPAALSDDPSSGPVVLAFRDTQSWTAAFKSCESQITAQCEAGIRIGCSINASNKCSSPWWKNLFGVSKIDFAEREKCEEREMAICVESSIANCHKFAKDKCLPAFRDARIAISNPKQDRRYTSDLIACASLPDNTVGYRLLELMWFKVPFNRRFELTNFRGSDILDTKIESNLN